MKTIFLLALLSQGGNSSICHRNVMLHVNPHPMIVIDQINDFSRKVATEIKEMLRAGNLPAQNPQNKISLSVYCDREFIKLTEGSIAALSVLPKVQLDGVIKSITDELIMKLCLATFHNSTFRNQDMSLVEGWELQI